MDAGHRGRPHRGVPTYLGSGDPAGRFTDYYPAWIDKLADDVTVEGSLLDGAVQGAEAVRTILVTIRGLYDRQAGSPLPRYVGTPRCGRLLWPASIVLLSVAAQLSRRAGDSPGVHPGNRISSGSARPRTARQRARGVSGARA